MKTITKFSLLALLAAPFCLPLFTGCSSNSSPSSPSAPTNTPVPFTNTPFITNTATNSPTKTPTPTPSSTATASPTATSSNTATSSPTLTPTDTASNTPTDTPSPTVTNTPTITATTCSNYGQTSHDADGSTNPAYYYANQVILSQATTMDSMSVGGFENSVPGETIYLALYDTSTGSQLFSGSSVYTNAQALGNPLVTIQVTPTVGLPAATYNLVVCVPSATSHFQIGVNSVFGQFDYGTYAGGAPPANFSTLAAGSLFGGFGSSTLNPLYFHGCP